MNFDDLLERLADHLDGYHGAECHCRREIDNFPRAALSGVPEGAASDRLTPFLRRVESDHRQGDWTEDGWVGNSINGTECVKDGQRWPCSAAALRLAILHRPVPSPEPLDVEEIGALFHDARYGVFSVHDGTGSPPFTEPVVACGYCRGSAERMRYALDQRARLAAPQPIREDET